VPVLTALYPEPGATLEAHVSHIWTADVRLVGAGAMAVAALWTLGRLAHPLVTGFVRTIAASRQAQTSGDHTDQDMSPAAILIISLLCLIVIAVLVENFAASGPLAGSATALTIAALPFVVIAGFIVAAICGYMAGLTGSSNSPVSGVGILAIVASAAIFAVIVHPTPATAPALIALALFVTAIVFGVAIVSNDNLQDLKTGQLVGASPKRQQIALIIGVIAGAAVIPLVLNLLAHAYGFAGAPHNDAIAAKPLAAPQANLISALALGVIGGTLNWTMIGIGIGLGVVIAVIDSILGAKKLMRLPPLAVGMGLYLPMSLTVALLIGALIGSWYNRETMKGSDPIRSQHLGVLVASGMIVGESLFEILRAGLIVGFNTAAPLGIVPEDFSAASVIGGLSYAVIIVFLYGWLIRRMKPQGTQP
jgi:putative OPT family oligopeptide transporter